MSNLCSEINSRRFCTFDSDGHVHSGLLSHSVSASQYLKLALRASKVRRPLLSAEQRTLHSSAPHNFDRDPEAPLTANAIAPHESTAAPPPVDGVGDASIDTDHRAACLCDRQQEQF